MSGTRAVPLARRSAYSVAVVDAPEISSKVREKAQQVSLHRGCAEQGQADHGQNNAQPKRRTREQESNMEDLYAYAFESTLTMKQMFECLNKRGPWRWSERDNDAHGEYLSTRVLLDPHIGFVKIFEAEGKYAINVKLKTDAADGRALFDDIKKKVFDTILPSITATLLGPVDDYG